MYSKTLVKLPLKNRQNKGLNDNWFCFVWFDSLLPINNLSVLKGWVFLGWTSTKLGLMFLLKDTTQWRRWGSNPRPLSLETSTQSTTEPLCSSLMKVKSIAECSLWNILQYFWPALSNHRSWKPFFGLFESGRFTQVLLYLVKNNLWSNRKHWFLWRF